MKRLTIWLPWVATALVAGFVALNWNAMMASAPLNLVVTQVQAPVGAVMAGITLALAVLFLLVHVSSQLGSLLETRRLLKEAQKAHERADQAEASRIENLKTVITAEFARLHERLDLHRAATDTAMAPRANQELVESDPGEGTEFKPMSLTEIMTGGRRH